MERGTEWQRAKESVVLGRTAQPASHIPNELGLDLGQGLKRVPAVHALSHQQWIRNDLLAGHGQLVSAASSAKV